MNVEVRRVPLFGPPICTAYVEERERVASYYLAGPPGQLASYRRVAQTIRESSAHSRWEALSEAFQPDDAQTRARLEQLIEDRGLFVATGQQAGLFTGPLLTLYKALTAARLADDLQERLQIPVMPLFAIAAEDHDWEEVNHTTLIDLENRLVRIAVGRADEGEENAPRPPVGRIRLGSDIEHALNQLTETTPDTEFKSDVLAPLREAYRAGRTFSEAFESALGHLLRRYPFLLVQTSHPYVKRETSELLWAEWRKRRESEARLIERAEQLSAAGFQPQVPVPRGATNLFLEGSLGRDRVLQDDGGARLRRSGERLTEREFRPLVLEERDRVSPSALLRPVAEARAFPVVAHVAGPSEIAYLAQSQVLFSLHGVPAPVVVPRAAIQLIEPRVRRVLEKYDLRAADLRGDSAQAISRLIKGQTPPELRESLEALRSSVGAALAAVEAAALEFDPGARSAVGSGKQAIFESIKALEAKLQARVREKHAVMRQQLEKAALHLYPNGRPQERVLNPYPYLIRYGASLVDALYQSALTAIE